MFKKKVCKWDRILVDGKDSDLWGRSCDDGFVDVGREEKYCGRCGSEVRLIKTTTKLTINMSDETWVKHMSAEDPSELCWNEVYGLGSMRDVYEIARLELQVKDLKRLVEQYRPSTTTGNLWG